MQSHNLGTVFPRKVFSTIYPCVDSIHGIQPIIIMWRQLILQKDDMMNIQEQRVVKIHYTLKNDDGEILDSSEAMEPFAFLCGADNIIRGLESALIGKTIGDQIDVTVEPEDGYGTRREELQQELPLSNFDEIDDIQVGMYFQTGGEDDGITMRIVAIDGDKVIVDGNHELAGIRLHFSISIESVRDATPEELDHGHVH